MTTPNPAAPVAAPDVAATCDPPPEHRAHRWHWLLTDMGKLVPLEWDELWPVYILNCAHEDPVALHRDGWRYHGPADPVAAAEITRLRAEVEELRAKLDRARPLVALLTVRQVIQGGDDAIAASGLNPWCINEGRATGDEPIGTWWLG